MITDKINDIRHYIETIDEALKLAAEKNLAESEPTEVNEYYDGPGLDYFRIVDEFPKFTWASTFVTTMSYLEYEMKHLANFLSEILGKPKFASQQDILKSIMKHLKDVCKVNVPDQTRAWNHICKYNLIRNVIVHKRSEVTAEDREEISNYTNSHSSIVKLEKNDFEIELSKAFCLEAVKTAKDLIVILVDECRKVIPLDTPPS